MKKILLYVLSIVVFFFVFLLVDRLLNDSFSIRNAAITTVVYFLISGAFALIKNKKK